MLITVLAFVVAFLIALSVGLVLFYREAMLDRLADVTSRADGSHGIVDRILAPKCWYL
jgi:hypothetical protein